MYPAGASPTGALDMAGTVWEWCLNKFASPEVTPPRHDDFYFRVPRGGSWSINQDYRALGRPLQARPAQSAQQRRVSCDVFVPIIEH